MNGIRQLLFRLWIWRKNRQAEQAFEKQLEQEQDTVRINWVEEFGREYAEHRPRHRRR